MSFFSKKNFSNDAQKVSRELNIGSYLSSAAHILEKNVLSSNATDDITRAVANECKKKLEDRAEHIKKYSKTSRDTIFTFNDKRGPLTSDMGHTYSAPPKSTVRGLLSNVGATVDTTNIPTSKGGKTRKSRKGSKKTRKHRK